MKDLDEEGQAMERSFGFISAMNIVALHDIAVAAGSKWELSKPETIRIPVNKNNAAAVYAWCKSIRSGYDVGISPIEMKRIKAARSRAHKFLVQEANDPNTPIERKIQLVKLTSKE